MDTNGTTVPASEFLEKYRAKLRHIFHVRADIDKESLRRGLPPYVLREIMACNPLSACIPSQYGGRGGHIHESLAVLAASSYESLALSLTFGINWALFLQPVAKYGQDEVKGPYGVVRVASIKGDRVRLAFSFPRHIDVHRREIADQIISGEIDVVATIRPASGNRS